MDEQQARQILEGRIQNDGRLDDMNKYEYVAWRPGYEKATLDGEFTADELEAISFWMRADGYRHGAQT